MNPHASHLIRAHFRGRISPNGERVMRLHLVDCADCRADYDRHLGLAVMDPSAALPAIDRLARGLGLPARRRAAPGWLAFAVGAAACAAALLAVGLGRSPGGLQPRGGAAPGSQLLVYDVANGKPAQSVVSELRPDSRLAFAYANIRHKQRLMVFAVDEGRRVYWYHPAWQRADDDPAAVEIARDDGLHEIPQAVAHRFAGRRLQLFGVFLDRPVSVREMEAIVARAPADEKGRLSLGVAGADVTRLDLNLVPAR